MDAQVKAKWVAALRSGKYKQGQQNLKTKWLDNIVEHCCLGVLCEIVGPTVAKEESHREHQELFAFRDVDGYVSTTMLPPGIRNAVGLLSTEASKLAGMNDGGKSFAEIADYIEGNL